MELISIYIVSKNYGKYANKAIRSVLNQSYKNWELFLANDNSNDNTKQIFSKYKNNKKIKIFNKATNQGLQKIANQILSKCRGKYIMRLDADDWLNEFALELMLKKIEKNNTKIVIPGYYYVNEKGKILGIENNLISIKAKKHIPFHGACTLIEVNTLKKVGGYFENVIAQDGLDIWYKLKNKNIKFDVINLPLFYYRKHKSSVSENKKKIYSARSKILNLQKSLKNDLKKIKVLAILPIKENYKNYKNIPFKKFYKKTLLEHSIYAAKKCKLISNIMVSTSSKKILNFLKKQKKQKLI